jgi:F-type H+-transporting ATPase subunit epsilon
VPFELVIVTPRQEAYRGEVESVVLPGSEGDFGVLRNHERFLSPLRIGAAEIREASRTVHAALADGFAQVTGESVCVLVESCELADQIDVAQARHAAERAEQGLGRLGLDENAERYAQYEAQLERARNRLAVAERAGR